MARNSSKRKFNKAKGVRRGSETQISVPKKKFPGRGYQPTKGKVI